MWDNHTARIRISVNTCIGVLRIVSLSRTNVGSCKTAVCRIGSTGVSVLFFDVEGNRQVRGDLGKYID